MYTIVSLLLRLISAYELLIVADAILSWVPSSAGSWVYDVRRALATLTDPFVGIFRNLIPSVGGSGMRVDFSPLVAIVALQLLRRLVVFILL